MKKTKIKKKHLITAHNCHAVHVCVVVCETLSNTHVGVHGNVVMHAHAERRIKIKLSIIRGGIQIITDTAPLP